MSGLEIPLLIGGLVGTGLDIYGGIKGAEAQEEAALRELQLRREEAGELLQRQSINEELLRERGQEMASQYRASFAGSGREGGIGGSLRIKSDIEKNIALSRRDAEFRARQIQAGAQNQVDASRELLSNSYLSSAGKLFGTGLSLYNTFKPAKTPTGLSSAQKTSLYGRSKGGAGFNPGFFGADFVGPY